MSVSEAQAVTAMKSPEHLKRWLQESGREWLVFSATDLVDALRDPWPGALQTFQSLLEAYDDHRRTIPSGEMEKVKHPDTGEEVDVEVMKTETLTRKEKHDVIAFLERLIREDEADEQG